MFRTLPICLYLLSCLISLGLQSAEPIVVKLSTGDKLIPTYVSTVDNQGGDFSEEYLRKLEEMVRFDLNYSGFMRVAKRSETLDKLAGSFSSYDDLETWRKNKVFYLVKLHTSAKGVKARVVGITQGYIQDTDQVALTGNFDQDRSHIHLLSDTIVQGLFNAPGVAQTHILYTVQRKTNGQTNDWTSEVWECDYDGGNPRQLTQENCLCVSPSYVPPTRKGAIPGSYLFVSYKTGQPKIYLADLESPHKRRLTTLPGNQLMPVMSPNRDAVAFISDVTSNPDLFLQPIDHTGKSLGKPRQIYAAGYATQASPTFSPDGTQVAFVSSRGGSPRIYTMKLADAKGRNVPVNMVTKLNRENTAPAWSPDGKKIAFCARDNGDRQIWIVDIASGVERQLTDGPGNKENPSWAPDSLHLTFNSADGNSSKLYLINLNQPEAVCISEGLYGEARYPCWEPLRI